MKEKLENKELKAEEIKLSMISVDKFKFRQSSTLTQRNHQSIKKRTEMLFGFFTSWLNSIKYINFESQL